MPARRKVVAGALMLLYPLVVHTAVVYDQIAIASISLLVISVVATVIAFSRASEHRGVLVFMFGLLAVLSLLNLITSTRYALYLMPILINLLMLAVFASSLWPGREPLITVFHRLTVNRDIDPVLVTYTRRLTWVWAMLFAAMALASAALAIFSPLAVWSLFTNFLNYLFVLALLVGEYFFRILHFRHYPHPSLLKFLRHLLQIDWIRATRFS